MVEVPRDHYYRFIVDDALCRQCNTPLFGLRRKFCSQKCSTLFHNNSRYTIPNVKNCKVCEGLFKPKQSNSRFCSQKCARRASYIINEKRKYFNDCEVCGIHFQTSHKFKKACSLECQNELNLKTKREYYHLVEAPKIDALRKELGIPPLSTRFGRVSEARLLYLIITLFPNDTVIRNDRTTLSSGLELDIYLPEQKIAFEYNGIQHYHFFQPYHKTEEDFIAQQKRDIEKQANCREQGISLITIKYTEELSELLILEKLAQNNLRCIQTCIY